MKTLYWEGLYDFSKKHDIDIIAFSCAEYSPEIGVTVHHDLVYKLAGAENVDGLIIASGFLEIQMGQTNLRKLCESYKPLPVVSMALEIEGVPSAVIDHDKGMTEAVEHLITVHGRKKIAFIGGPENHQEVVSRYKSYKEALARHEIPLDENLVIFTSFTRKAGYAAALKLVYSRKATFDAIVFLDDPVALGAIEALQSEGIDVPHAVSVIGYDDEARENRVSSPPLSSVEYPFVPLIITCGELLLDIIAQREVPMITTIPSRLVCRESCGCVNKFIYASSVGSEDSFEASESAEEPVPDNRSDLSAISDTASIRLTREHRKTLVALTRALLEEVIHDRTDCLLSTLSRICSEYLRKGHDIMDLHPLLTELRNAALKRIVDRQKMAVAEDVIHRARIHIGLIAYNASVRKLFQSEDLTERLNKIGLELMTTYDVPLLMDKTNLLLPDLNVERCYIALYKDRGKYSAQSRMVLAFDESGRMNCNADELFSTKEIIPAKYIRTSKKYQLIFEPLMLRGEHLGYALFQVKPHTEMFFKHLANYIGSALMGAILIHERMQSESTLRDTLSNLENVNRELEQMSLTDHLTGLYNRRGFLTLSGQQMSLCERQQNDFNIFFVNIDGIRTINDTFGHSEGDSAIIAAGKILLETFRKSDIIARLREDKFCVFTIDSALHNIEETVLRLSRYLETYNQTSEKKYALSLSLGWASHRDNPEYTIEDLISAAQHILKTRKKQKEKYSPL